MRNLINLLLMLLAISASSVLGQTSKQEQQPPPTSQNPRVSPPHPSLRGKPQVALCTRALPVAWYKLIRVSF